VRFVGLRLASGTGVGRSGPSRWRGAALAAALLVSAGVGSSCHPDEHVGRPCELGTSVTNAGATIQLADGALECPSRICLSAANAVGTGPLCSASCASNDDCADGERGDPNDPADPRCKTGFACMWPTTVGRLNCRRLCVCRDLVSEPTGGFQKPTVCP